jgi:uncharacterized protein YdeI (YjbR/CyaY-like superfamily)
MAAPTSFAHYLEIGCMRCKKGGTDQCKVLNYIPELQRLHAFVGETELVEEIKWSTPTYTLNGKNVVMVMAFVDHVSISFMKGALLDDPKALLTKAGENTQASRVLRFTKLEEIEAMADDIRALIASAIEVERQGLKVEKVERTMDVCDELQAKFDEQPEFKAAFEALTPGRQRAYHMHFNQAKQASTRLARIEKYEAAIFEGKGMHDDYRMK